MIPEPGEEPEFTVQVPSWRLDVEREIDVIEEVARLEGYNAIPVGSQVTHPVTPEAPALRVRKAAAGVLHAAGFDETVTISFIDAKEAGLFGCGDPIRADELVRRTQNALRPTVVPSLLRICKLNQDAGNTEDVKLFELSQVFLPVAGSLLPEEHLELAMVAPGDLRALRGVVEAVFERLAPLGKLDIQPRPMPGLDDAAAAEIRLNDQPAGWIGPVSAGVLSAYGLGKPLSAAAVNLDALGRIAGAVRRFRPLPRFPAIVRDLSFIVEEELAWSRLQAAIDAVQQPLRSAIEYVTTYRGKPIPEGRKSLTVRLTYRSEEATLRAEQVEDQVHQVVAAMKQDLGAELRA